MKKFVFLLALTICIIMLAVPTTLGWMLRSNLAAAVEQLPANDAFRLELRETGFGWLNSELHLRLYGAPYDGFYENNAGIPLLLELTHGPLMWNLPDSPFALAHLQLGLPERYEGPAAGRLSGSALLQLDRGGQAHFNGILGLPAFDGDHTLQLQTWWPARESTAGWRSLANSMTLNLSIDADASALLNSPAADALRVYEQQGWTRYSQGRALTYLSLRNGWLDINGQVFPLGNLIGTE